MTVVGARRLKRKWAVKIPKEVTRAARIELEKSAKEYVSMMRRLVGVKDGKLLASIGWTWGKPPKNSFVVSSASGPNETAITIYAGDASTIVTNKRGIEFQNAFIQEFGSKNMPANPFFLATDRVLRRRSRGRVTRAIRKAIKANG